MRIWLPYTEGGSGTDVFTQSLARAIRDLGVDAQQTRYHGMYQYAPGLLRVAKSPLQDPVTIANSWTAFPFAAGSARTIVVVHLCVHDPAYAPFRSTAQSIFHNTFVRRHEALSFRRADRVVAVSHATAAAVSQAFKGVNPVVIENGIDTEFFTPRRGESKGPPDSRRPFRLLFVGNPTRRKGADLIGPVMARLGRQFELRITAGNRNHAIPLADNIHNIGTLTAEGVREAYREADALFFPSRLEGLPLAVIEAMACGTPVIGSNQSSMPEVIDDGVTGLLGDLAPDALVRLVREAASHPNELQIMGVNARREAVARFDQRRMAREYLALAEELMAT